MAKQQSNRHKGPHKVRLIQYPSGYKEFFCTLPDCPYRVRAQLFIGKLALCNECGREFEVTSYHMRRALPKCINCIPHRGSTAKRQFVLPTKKEDKKQWTLPSDTVIQFSSSSNKEKDPVDELKESLNIILADGPGLDEFPFLESSEDTNDSGEDGDI